MQKEFQQIGRAAGLDKSRVEYTLKIALQQAFCEYFNISECEIDDMDSRLIKAVFRVPENMPVAEAEVFQGMVCEDDIITVEFDFNALPVSVQHTTHDLFVRYIDEVRLDEAYLKWKKLVHGAVEGVIAEKHGDRITVSLGDDNVIGIMLRPHWTPNENPLYVEGRAFLFYLLKVNRDRHVVKIYLSRTSKNFPCAVLSCIAPWIRAKSIKRIAGKKSWLVVDSPVEMEVINTLRRELKGEAVEVSEPLKTAH